MKIAFSVRYWHEAKFIALGLEIKASLEKPKSNITALYDPEVMKSPPFCNTETCAQLRSRDAYVTSLSSKRSKLYVSKMT